MDNNISQFDISKLFAKIWRWTIMILLWLSIYVFWKSLFYVMKYDSIVEKIIKFVYGSSVFENPYSGPLIIMIILYITYAWTASTSLSQKYLNNLHKAESIHEYMKKMFFTPPKITWHIVCYHYETRLKEETKPDGSKIYNKVQEKVISCTASDYFHYNSWRDISGLFILDSHKIIQSEKKAYIKLKLDYEIQYVDSETKLSYQNQKDNFYNGHRYRDTYVEISESRYIPDFDEYSMIKISVADSYFVNKWLYILFVYFIPLLAIYESYLEDICVEQDFKLKKIISDRNDLNQQQNFMQYQHLVPSMIIFNQAKVVFGENIAMKDKIHNIHNINFDQANKSFHLSSDTQCNQVINQSQYNQPNYDFPDKDSVLSNHTIVRSNRKGNVSNNVSRLESKKSLFSLKSKQY